MKMRVLPLTLSLVLLGGCSLMPDYQRPDVTTINGWERSEQSAAAAADTHWQALFADPALTRVIRLGLDHNPDLRSALLNVERYRAQYRIQRADLLPTLALDGSGTRQRVPDELSQSGEATISSQYSATVGLTAWELDLFGRVRSLKEQALQTYLAQEQTRRSVQLTLVASIANAYLDWVADREQLTLAQQTRQIEADNLALVRKRYELGVASELELAQAEAALEDAEVTLSRYRRLTALDRNALTLLVGARRLAAQRHAGRHPHRRCQPRPAIRAADPPSRHSGSGASAAGSQRQHRCCAGRVLSEHQPDGERRQPQRRAEQPVCVRQRHLAVQPQHQPADLQRRAPQCAAGRCRGGSRPRADPV
jgi:multidrug efflux system outer membrane protein